jgi:hypothetical protein
MHPMNSEAIPLLMVEFPQERGFNPLQSGKITKSIEIT